MTNKGLRFSVYAEDTDGRHYLAAYKSYDKAKLRAIEHIGTDANWITPARAIGTYGNAVMIERNDGKAIQLDTPKEIKYTIPLHYYRYGTPVHTDYEGNDRSGLAVKESPEVEMEMERVFGFKGTTVMSLLSPYIIGWESPYTAQELEVVEVNIEEHYMIARVK